MNKYEYDYASLRLHKADMDILRAYCEKRHLALIDGISIIIKTGVHYASMENTKSVENVENVGEN